VGVPMREHGWRAEEALQLLHAIWPRALALVVTVYVKFHPAPLGTTRVILTGTVDAIDDVVTHLDQLWAMAQRTA
jgi:hypothetical protein